MSYLTKFGLLRSKIYFQISLVLILLLPMGYQLFQTHLTASVAPELDLNGRVNPLKSLLPAKTRTSVVEIHDGTMQSTEKDNHEDFRPQETNFTQRRPPCKITEITGTYEDHAAISIDGNTDFHITASSELWSGTGMAGAPYIIEDYNITGTAGTEYLIDIRNTDVHFNINHSLLHGGSHGLYFENVTNSKVSFVDAYNNTQDGFYLYSSSNNTLSSNTVYNNSDYGIFLSSSSNNTLSSNTAYNNSDPGFYLAFSSNNTLNSNTAYNNSNYGIYLSLSSNNNTLIDNTVYNNSDYGILLSSSCNNNTLSSNTAYNNPDGFYLSSSHNNTLISNTAYDNSYYGFLISSSTNNTFTSNTANNNSESGFYLLSSSNNNTFIRNTANNNSYAGFILRSSSNNTLTSNTANNNSYAGFILRSSSNNNTLINNTAYNNSYYGFYLWSSSNNNTLTRNTISDNSKYGIYVTDSNNGIIQRNKFMNNNGGFTQAYDDGSNNNFEYNYWDDWTSPDVNNNFIVDLPYVITGTAGNNDSFPLVIFVLNHAPISINGNTDFFEQASSEGWNGIGTAGAPYFIGDYNITGTTGTEYLIDIRNTDVYFNISQLLLHGGARGLYFQNVTNSKVSDVYAYNNNYGFNLNSFNNSVLSYNTAYNNSDYGFVLAISHNNTLINNTAYINSDYGFYLISSSDNTLTSNTAYNNTYNGFCLSSSSNNTLTSNKAYNNTQNGFRFESSSDNTLTSNKAYNNSNSGFILVGSRNNTLTNNTAYINSDYGFYLYLSSNNNTLTNNTAYNNSGSGFSLYLSSNNTLINNKAYNNSNSGFYLWLSNNNTLTSNKAYYNSWEGFLLSSSSNNSLTRNKAYNNSEYGFLISSSTNNTFTSNTANNNSESGFYLLSSSNNNTFIRNTANNSYAGFILRSSSNNTLTSNTAYNNSYYGFYLWSSSNNNTLTRNTISDNSKYGIYVTDSNNGIIQRNKFMNNNGGFTQAYDGGSNNIFQFNYWSDWTNPDIDGNLVVDLPYTIDGSAINQDDYPLVIFFIAPIITLINPINNTDQQSGTIIIVNVVDPTALDQVKYNWDGSGNTTVSLANSSYVFNSILPISEVQHILFVYAQDHIGNWHFRQFNFVTDDTPPQILLNSPMNGSIHLSGTSIDITLVGSNGSLIYHWNSDGNITVTDTFDPVLPVGDGVHNLYLYARDEAGNWNFTYLEFTTDDPLAILLNNPNNGTVLQSGSIIDLTITGSNRSLVYHWDTGNNQTVADTVNPILPTGDGLHQLYLYAKDEVNNWIFVYFEFVTDDTSPQITLVSDIYLNNTAILPDAQIQFDITDASQVQVWITWNGGPTQNISVLLTVITLSSEGWHELIVYANDSAGLLTSSYYKFYVDISAPVITLQDALNGTQVILGTTIFLNINDPFLANVTYYWDSDTSVTVSVLSETQVPLSSGWHILRISAVDTVGSTESAVFRFFVKISVAYDPEEWIIPSTVFEGDQFTLEFTFTNNEALTLGFVAFLLGEDDNVLEGNGTSFSLAPGQSQTLFFIISPKHASPHIITFVVYNGDEIVIEEPIQFEVRPFYESPLIQGILMVVGAIIIILVSVILLFMIGSYKRKQGERFMQKVGAPDHATSVKIKEGGFPNFDSYQMGQVKKAETYSQLKLVEKYFAPDYPTAVRIQEGEFPIYDIYQQALKEGFSTYDSWKLKEDRKGKLVKLMERADRIGKNEFMTYMAFTDDTRFIEWILALPEESPLRLDGDMIVFKQQNLADANVLKAIDQLMQSYSIDESEITGEEITKIKIFLDEIKPNIQVTINSIADKTGIAKNKVDQILSDLTKIKDSPGEYFPHENIFIKRSVDLESSEEGFSSYIQKMEKRRKRKQKKKSLKKP